MPCDAKTLERLDALEREVEKLRQERNPEPREPQWMKIVGIMDNHPGFDEVVEYGRRIRAGEMEVPDLPRIP